MNKEMTVDYIVHPDLPGEIWLACTETEMDSSIPPSAAGVRRKERLGGRSLIGAIVAEKIGGGTMNIDTAENRKPKAHYEREPIEISISHCPGLIIGAVSREFRLGIDLERTGRKIHPGLKERIVHPDEEKGITDMDTLRLWTIKESALKWSGSGLRKSMSHICVYGQRDAGRYRVRFPDGTGIETVSFRFRDFWLAVSYGEEGIGFDAGPHAR